MAEEKAMGRSPFVRTLIREINARVPFVASFDQTDHFFDYPTSGAASGALSANKYYNGGIVVCNALERETI